LALKFHLNSTKFAEQNQGGISTGYPIYIFDTRVGNGVTSIDSSDSSKVGIGTTFVDNIYYISSWSYSGIVGIITCNILSTTSVVGLNSTGTYQILLEDTLGEDCLDSVDQVLQFL
jgi:hypothetical protein